MAVEPVRRPRDLTTTSPVALAGYPATTAPRVRRQSAKVQREWPRGLVRALEMAPGLLALSLISTLVWGFIWFPMELAIGLLIFDAYWLWKSWTIAYHVVKGVRLIRQARGVNWRRAYEAAALIQEVLPWEQVKHVVIIPNYQESTAKLRDTLQAMAGAAGARESVIPVLAMEASEPDSLAKAELLAREFEGSFYRLLITLHPAGIPGEVRGKSSNEAWAARRAVEELVDRRGLSIDHLTVTSCDADTIFPEQYFECLRYRFSIDPARYRRFWQAPIFFYNNIWQVPAILRVPNALGGLIHLSRLSRKRRVLFSQSTYSLSMRMAHDVGYWDADVIPEDWHMFLKCFYKLGGEVDVEPIHLPIGNDGALSKTARATYVNQYLQVRRWAWGAVDIPFVFQEAVRRSEIPLRKRFLRFWYVLENHLMWSTQWFFITLGGLIPFLVNLATGDKLMPEWFTWGSRILLTPCLLPYLVLIVLDARLRPPRPPSLSRLRYALSFLLWLAVSPITFFFSALPALDSQVRLLLGKRMEYRVTEKA
jgi:hypothetical protein